MSEQIPLFEIAWDENDISNVVQSITRGGYWAKGPFVEEFEARLADYFGTEHAITVNSGTTALVAGLKALGIGPGDEVIVPSFTFVATANAVRLVGAEPVFADIETESYGLDVESVEEKITTDTSAIMPVHLYGEPCRIEQLADVAQAHDLQLIEDAAEAFGATANGEYVGTFGEVGAYSFCQNKIVVTGEGGAVVTDDDELAAKIRLFRSHGRATTDYFESEGSGEYVELGTNIRMSDLTAALGCSQIAKVDDLLQGRREAAAYLNERLSELSGVRVPRPRDGATHAYQLYTVEFAEHIDRSTIIDTLQDRGISSKIYWDTPVHKTQYYRNTRSGTPSTLPKTEQTAARVLSLPMYPDLSTRQADRIVEGVRAGLERAE